MEHLSKEALPTRENLFAERLLYIDAVRQLNTLWNDPQKSLSGDAKTQEQVCMRLLASVQAIESKLADLNHKK